MFNMFNHIVHSFSYFVHLLYCMCFFFFYFRQNTELNNMRSECSNLMKDLAETKNKLQQEELQRKSLEVSYKQSVSQLEVRVNSIHTLLFQL